jgi:hypothetical protein
MPVPFTFGTATAAIPLSQLDNNFATTITLGNTAIQLGNTVTTLNNMTLANVTVSSGTINGAVTLSYSNANAVVYSNASNVGVTSANLTFNGTNFGIGTSSPSTTLDLSSTTNGVIAKFKSTSTYGQVVADNGSSTGGGVFITRQNGTNTAIFGNTGGILGDTSTNVGIYSAVVGGSINFYTDDASTLKLSINSVGGLKAINTIGVGNATPSTSGAGITFPAILDPSSDANTLDDYEEGTWTPALTGGTLTVNSATYTKIGNRVLLSMDVSVASVSAGNITLTGVPFASSDNSISAVGGDVFTWSTELIGLHAFLQSTSIAFFYFTSGSNGIRLTDSNIGVGTTIRCTFQYKV